MKQEIKDGNILPGELSPAGADEAASTSAYETSSGTRIDFHSAEFNQMDDLNDCYGNYRTFQSLDGVVTADMRHQMERRQGGEGVATVVDPVPAPKNERETNVATTLLTVVSQGRTLIIATEAEPAIACGQFLSERGLTCTLLLTKPTVTNMFAPRFTQLTPLAVDAVAVTGTFGGFSAVVTGKGEQRPLTGWLGDEASVFDLVLDLQATPSFTGGRLPLGYYAPGGDPSARQEMMAELPEMRGRFQRPQFLAFLPNRCFHGRSRTRACRQCLTVCPYGAIQSVDRAIVIDHYRCQGCGGCALVCPAEAIHLTHPPPEDLLTALRHTLEDRAAAAPLTLVISDCAIAGDQQGAEREESDNSNRVYFGVEQIGHVGLEMLLAALAYGAGAVVVACGAQNPPDIRKAAEWQANLGGAILQGLGMGDDKIRFVIVSPEAGESEKSLDAPIGAAQPDRPFLPPAALAAESGKRALVRWATQLLYDQSGTRECSISLPPGAPFGTVAVDSAACTLCMACVVACPAGALSAQGEVPKLEFIESRCHQCGLCTEACPERAISLLPRLLCDLEAVASPVVLNATEPVRCIQCGVPFASQAMINRIRGKLTGHWMYAADRQLRRLQMCCTCRTRDALVSQDTKPSP